jgi:hypothetical protein
MSWPTRPKDLGQEAYDVRSMAFQSAINFLPGLRWVLESLLFVADKFRDLSLQEPESPEIAGSGTSHLPAAPVRVGPVNEAYLGRRSIEQGGSRFETLRG